MITRLELETLQGELRRIAERHELGDALSGLNEATQRIRRTTFRLVVLGEYKRGKSTLINALLGKPVLPTAVVPLTSVVTEIEYGTSSGARIEFRDGGSIEVPTSRLAEYVTEPENPHNRKHVRRAIVSYPAPLLAEGVTVLDTPGVGSVFEHNTLATYGMLEEADAVLVVLAADQPMSSEEHALLGALEGITDRILFAVNRVDVLSEGELAESLQFIGSALGRLDPEFPGHVFPISARGALRARSAGKTEDDGFGRFQAALHRVLVERKSEILLERAQTLTCRTLDLLTLRLEAERQATVLEGAALEQAVETFRATSAGARERFDQASVLFRNHLERIPDRELKRVEDPKAAEIRGELWPHIEARLASRERPRGWADAMALDVGQRVVGRLRPFYHVTETIVRASFDRALADYMARVQASLSEIVEASNRILGMRCEVPRVVTPLSERAGFYFKEWDGAGGQFLGSRWWLRLPRRWAERRVAGLFRELLDRRINQNIAAIHYDWVMRLHDAIRMFEVASRDQLETTQRMIVDALAAAQRLRTEREAGSVRAALDRDLEQIGAIRLRLEAAAGRGR